MAKVEDIYVTIRARDEFTPVLRRAQRRLWWMEHGETLMRAVTVLLVLAAYILGRLTS